jgi:hypothetical protein
VARAAGAAASAEVLSGKDRVEMVKRELPHLAYLLSDIVLVLTPYGLPQVESAILPIEFACAANENVASCQHPRLMVVRNICPADTNMEWEFKRTTEIFSNIGVPESVLTESARANIRAFKASHPDYVAGAQGESATAATAQQSKSAQQQEESPRVGDLLSQYFDDVKFVNIPVFSNRKFYEQWSKFIGLLRESIDSIGERVPVLDNRMWLRLLEFLLKHLGEPISIQRFLLSAHALTWPLTEIIDATFARLNASAHAPKKEKAALFESIIEEYAQRVAWMQHAVELRKGPEQARLATLADFAEKTLISLIPCVKRRHEDNSEDGLTCSELVGNPHRHRWKNGAEGLNEMSASGNKKDTLFTQEYVAKRFGEYHKKAIEDFSKLSSLQLMFKDIEVYRSKWQLYRRKKVGMIERFMRRGPKFKLDSIYCAVCQCAAATTHCNCSKCVNAPWLCYHCNREQVIWYCGQSFPNQDLIKKLPRELEACCSLPPSILEAGDVLQRNPTYAISKSIKILVLGAGRGLANNRQLVFCVLCFVFCVLCFVFCVLCFVFCVLCFVFCVGEIAN